MGPRAVMRPFLLALVASGCAVLAGLDAPAPGSTGNEMTPPADAGLDGATSADLDGSTAVETGTQCTLQISPIPATTLHASAWGPSDAPGIEGKFDEWRCTPHFELGAGEYTTTAFPKSDRLLVAVRWRAAALFVHLVAETKAPGFALDRRWLNDSLSLFVGPPGVAPTATYRAGDHRLVFDHQGFTTSLKDNIEQPFPAGVKVKSVSSTKNELIVAEHEIKIDAEVLGLTAFEQGKTYNLGLMFSDRVNLTTDDSTEYRLWHRHQECGCITGCCYANNKDEPGCDARCFGWLTLD